MKIYLHTLLMAASGTMMISCFYTCSSFILATIFQKPVSAAEAASILFLSTIITGIHDQRGWRKIFVAGLHVSGWLFSTLLLFHHYFRLDSVFWHPGWILDFFLLDRTMTGWLLLMLLIFSACFLWFCGIKLWTKPMNQTTLSHRFDLGLACLLALLLVKLIIAVKGYTLPLAHSTTIPIFAFIITGLFSLGLIRGQNSSQTGEITCFRGTGVILSFTLIILLIGGGLFFLFLPEFQTFAQAGGGLLGAVSKPIEQMVLVIARFFLESGYRLKTGADSPDGSLPALPVMEEPTVSGIIISIFTWLTIVILLAALSLLFYFMLKWLLKKLYSKTMKKEERLTLWELIGLFISAAKQMFKSVLTCIHLMPDTTNITDKFYRRLLRWGWLSGLIHDDTETPKEYGVRLGNRFPKIKKEIQLIILLHDEAVYGGITPDGSKISGAKYAMNKIRNPFLWFERIKSFCFQNRY